MPQIINTNIPSLTSQRNLNTSQNDVAVALQRLSSGLRINSARDDAAGLAISERFTTQIRGLNQAARNANDGISLAQTAEGSLAEVTNNLQRIRELAVQSVNATNSDSDRAALDLEVQQRLQEIDRIAQQTAFNGRNVLDGSFGSALFQVGANVGETIGLSLETSVRTSDIGAIATATSVDLDTLIEPSGITLAAGELTVGGTDITGTFADASALAAGISAAGITGVTATEASGVVTVSNTTTSSVAIAGTNNVLGIASVGAATLGANTESIAASNFNQYTFSDLTISDETATTTAAISGTFTAAEAATAINAALTTAGLNTEIVATDNAGVLEIEQQSATAGQEINLGGVIDSALFSATTADGDGTNEAIVTLAASEFDEAEITDLTLTVEGGTEQAIAAGGYEAADLVTAINTAFNTSGGTTGLVLAAENAGAVDLTVPNALDLTFGGATDPTTFSLSDLDPTVTAATADTADISDTFAASSLTVAANGFTFTLGDNDPLAVAAGTYTTIDSFVGAINAALGSNANASLDSDNVLTITTGDAIEIDQSGVTDQDSAAATVFATTSVAASGNLTSVNVNTVDAANEAIQRIDSTLTTVSDLRSTFGAIQNRFESTIANLATTSENLTASRSRIQDADFAAETAALTRAQILQQAGIAVLAQANAQPQNVLALLQ